MPSAENLTSAATKLEMKPKSVENTQKENALDQNQEKSVPAIQQVISIISNKVRNLEKRKNKLDGYVKEEESGKELSSEQQKAVSKYDEVVQQLSLSKEFCKQFQGIASIAQKEAKREARKTLFTRQNQETSKVREVLMIQELLQRLKDEATRMDFLNSRNGACRVDKVEMEFIDTFAQQVVPLRPKFSNEQSFSSSAKTAAEHFSNLIDGRNRQIMETGLTYEKAKELFDRIQSCGYWEKNVKFVEVAVEESRAENDTPISEDLESKDGKSESGEKVLPVSAPAPAQVPTPSFNGNQNVVQQQQQQQHQQQQLQQGPMVRGPRQHQRQQAPLPAQNAPLNMKTTVTAVENSYFNQVKFSQPQGQLAGNGLPITPSQNDFGTNFSFLQESELDSSPAAPGSQQKMPVNVIQTVSQPKNSPVQYQQNLQQVQQSYNNANFHPQSPIAGQMYPPGLKVQPTLQNSLSHIPANYQASPQQQLNQQQPAAPSTQVQPNMIPKQQPVNGNQVAGYGASSQTPPIQQHVQPTSRPATVSKAQFQQQSQQNSGNQQSVKQPMEQKQGGTSQKHEGSGDMSSVNDTGRVQEKDKQHEDYQQQPQIDTWTNETAAQSGGSTNNHSSRGSGGGFNRNNRPAGGGGAKFSNFRNPRQNSNYASGENGNGDAPREGQAPGTFFRNNERYNGSPPTSTRDGHREVNREGNREGNRFENRGTAGGNFKPRENNHRAGSGRFAGSASASAQGSSNSGQRK